METFLTGTHGINPITKIWYVTIYTTLSHLYDDGLANQRQFKIKRLGATGHRTNVKVSRRLLRIE